MNIYTNNEIIIYILNKYYELKLICLEEIIELGMECLIITQRTGRCYIFTIIMSFFTQNI